MKTFFRLLLMSVAISFVLYPLFLFGNSMNMFASHFQWLSIAHSKDCYSALLNFHTFYYLVVVLGIPLYELAIYPLARNWIPSTLKRIGIGVFGTIIVASVALTVDSTSSSVLDYLSLYMPRHHSL